MAFAKGESRLTGAARLRLKESDRLAGMAGLLRALGGRVEEEPDGLRIARERTAGWRGRSLRRPPAGDGRGGGSPGLPGASDRKGCRMCGKVLSRMVGAFLRRK